MLHWKQKTDFVRMAARCGAIIVPFAAVGGDDAYDVAMDVQEVMAHPVLGQLARWGAARIDERVAAEDFLLPLTYIPGTTIPAPLPVPNLERLYFECVLLVAVKR